MGSGRVSRDEFWGEGWGTPRICVITTAVCNCKVDAVTEDAREGLMSEMLYADDLVLLSESMEGLREKFGKWKESFERNGAEVNLGKTKRCC